MELLPENLLVSSLMAQDVKISRKMLACIEANFVSRIEKLDEKFRFNGRGGGNLWGKGRVLV